jgi:hypothetical protein
MNTYDSTFERAHSHEFRIVFGYFHFHAYSDNRDVFIETCLIGVPHVPHVCTEWALEGIIISLEEKRMWW